METPRVIGRAVELLFVAVAIFSEECLYAKVHLVTEA
jgi:hypothetical protein